MATLLLIVIYICFIGLGIPDSLFGPAWPVMSGEFGLPISTAGLITPYFCLFTVISSLFSDKLINRFGTGRVTAISTMLTVVGLLGYSFSPNIWFFLLCAIPFGLGAGAVDAGLNNYVALHYKASHISYLHCFYGVGVTVSPVFMSLALAKLGDWHIGYRIAGFVQLSIALISVLAIPLWGKVAAQTAQAGKASDTSEQGEPDFTPRSLSLREQARDAGIRWIWLIFAVAVALEVLVGNWGSTFLVKIKGMEPAYAAAMTALYYFGLAAGRFISGLLSRKLTPWQIIALSLAVWPLSVVFFVLPIPPAVSGIGLLFAGLGMGPLYPNFVYLTPRNFGRDVSQSIMGSQSASAYLGLIAVPPLFGLLVNNFGVGLYPPFLAVVYAIQLAAVLMFIRHLKKRGTYHAK
ncbi:MAG: MFS transporter [Clostridia bacterium]|nr:MFS transporter [Clostridia bacterium]